MSAEKLEVISSLEPLVMLLLLQPRMLLAFVMTRAHSQLIFSLLSTQPPPQLPQLRAFSMELLPSLAVPNLYCRHGVISWQMQDFLQLSVLNFVMSVLAHSSSLSVSLDDSPDLKHIDCSPCKREERGLHHLLEIPDKGVKQDSSLQTPAVPHLLFASFKMNVSFCTLGNLSWL